MICVSLKGCALDWVESGEKYWVLRNLMMDSQGGIKGEMLERMQSLTSKGIDFTSKLLLPSRVEKTAILRHSDGREVEWKKERKKLILSEGKGVAEHPKIRFTYNLKFSTWDKKKNGFPNIWDHTIHPFIAGSPCVESKISTSWLRHLRWLTCLLWPSVSITQIMDNWLKSETFRLF